ncbi:hypothetical protein J437_LFUL007233 [Ladona fulva]|uniref:Uncharacterized protein n=1 Tax=Ladona fulva TaxID=123851 RepID=A0A8K0P0E5_LADFU|nr:hypothetical protein J437_LFUL007233 [Ladona fulva]
MNIITTWAESALPSSKENVNSHMGSRLVTAVEEIASAMLRLALEFGEKGFLQREFILDLRKLLREITGEGQQRMPQPTGARAIPPSVQPEIENVCQHPDHQLPPEYIASTQCPACIQSMNGSSAVMNTFGGIPSAPQYLPFRFNRNWSIAPVGAQPGELSRDESWRRMR